MNGALTRYLELHTELELERAARALSMAEEAEYAAELDRCWNEMSEEDHAALEESLAASSSIDAPMTLDEIDAPVAAGATEPPRRAAA